MSAPEFYATVIVPVHNRDSTLPFAIRSVQSQTVADIEIIISGDGVTEAVRRVAERLASTDSRIVFHDWRKAPKRGGENRDRAVRSARAPRIFYIDDDDLFLPHHVETLGPILDEYDAVDSAPASVSRSGCVHVGIVNHSRGALREALAARRAKAVFDTNFGHRKSVYERVGAPWAWNGDDPARDFFEAFAKASHIVWKSIPDVTAYSFHGAARRHVSDRDRSSELALWWKDIGRSSGAAKGVFYDWYTLRLVETMGLVDVTTVQQFLSASHIRLMGDVSSPEADVSVDIDGPQLDALDQVFSLLRREPILSEGVGDLAVRLADPLLGGRRFMKVARLLKRALGRPRALRVLENREADNPHSREIRAYMRSWLLLDKGECVRARHELKPLLDTTRFYPGEAEFLAALNERRAGDLDAALSFAQIAVAMEPALNGGPELVADLRRALGQNS